MSGAIAGAFYGESIISENLRRHCESNDEFTELADQLFEAAAAK